MGEGERKRQGLAQGPTGHCRWTLRHSDQGSLQAPVYLHRAIIHKQGQQVMSRVPEGISLFQLFNAWMLSQPAKFCLTSFEGDFHRYFNGLQISLASVCGVRETPEINRTRTRKC